MKTGSSSKDDQQIWFPPEPEEQEGTVFGQFREEKRRAILEEIRNGKFKAFVAHLLQSMAISCSGDDGDTWVDTVTALSWEAASFVKPDAFEGKPLDPDGYVKVKCIATGSRTQSEVFKGLIFKKHAAHKHMPAKYEKPRLLLVKGELSLSSDGLSSFDSIEQKKDRLAYLVRMIETSRPNVVLVEKTVARDIQEYMLVKGMTLVLEMKLQRLERVDRCMGLPILFSDLLNGQKLGQCDSFYFKEVVEEHAALGENGKRPRKILMFLEGCSKPVGCTILLKGAHREELKKIKCVVQFAVVVAYHLIVESSFLLDQKAMFSTITPNIATIPSISNQPLHGLDAANVPVAETDPGNVLDIPIPNEFHDKGSKGGVSLSSYEPYSSVVLSCLSSFSASLKKVFGFPLPDTTGQNSVQILSSPEAVDRSDKDTKVGSDKEKMPENEQLHSVSASSKASLETESCEDQRQKDDGNDALDSENILVLMSRHNAARGTRCEQSRFSSTEFYQNFDVPLGKFLQDNLLNQELLCGTCDEQPEAHLYYYAHHNMQLTVQVKRLPLGNHLPGESDRKLWMWSCCPKCRPSNGSLKSTKRVSVSPAAHGLPFWKLLEIGFSNFSSCDAPSTCGHSFHRDYFHFFGLGPMVAMFRYSPVATYSMSLTHCKVEFSDLVGGDYLKRRHEDLQGSILKFLDVEEMTGIIAYALYFVKDQKVGSQDVNEDIDDNISSLDGLEIFDTAASSTLLHQTVYIRSLDAKYSSVSCLFADKFLDLRSHWGISELDYIASLSRSKIWNPTCGKSEDLFAETHYDQFIVKEINDTEISSFMKFASDYFEYMNQFFKLGHPTCLAKILGIYQVNESKSGAKHDLMVIENITYGRNITREYDMKGALFYRPNSAADGTRDSLLDQHFLNGINIAPIYVDKKTKRNLQRAVWNDTAFLNSINVTDYSLLIGVDAQQRELVCGISDYIKQYTWDKQLEDTVKSFVAARNKVPTTISPNEYKKRLRKFVDAHFSFVPEDWCSQRSSKCCSLCGILPSGSSNGCCHPKSQEQLAFDNGNKDDSSNGTRSG